MAMNNPGKVPSHRGVQGTPTLIKYSGDMYYGEKQRIKQNRGRKIGVPF
jgi:hypothetical protein